MKMKQKLYYARVIFVMGSTDLVKCQNSYRKRLYFYFIIAAIVAMTSEK